uniref:Uncharacterized protein n=1 Tax=Rhinolophus ferrumequinum TaxID=59479 RepID=A0A671F1V3_RHIFE
LKIPKYWTDILSLDAKPTPQGAAHPAAELGSSVGYSGYRGTDAWVPKTIPSNIWAIYDQRGSNTPWVLECQGQGPALVQYLQKPLTQTVTSNGCERKRGQKRETTIWRGRASWENLPGLWGESGTWLFPRINFNS